MLAMECKCHVHFVLREKDLTKADGECSSVYDIFMRYDMHLNIHALVSFL